jgi:hypothetical protein
MRIATFIFSGVAAAASVATLGVVLFGAKKVEQQVEDVKQKTTKSLTTFKNALEDALENL